MARKKKLTKQDSIRDAFSFDGFEANHFRRTESYAAAIDRLYDAAVADFARLASTVTVDPDKPFEFAKGPAFQAKAQEIVDRLAAGMSAVIRTGTEKEWLYANQKNDAFLRHIMDTSKIGKRTMNKLSDRNLNALDAFQKRKVGGLDLSQRVWQYAGQTKSLMEMGIDIAVGDGRPATKLSRDLRSYLHEPEKLFRRVRDKHGNLVLSQRAAAYHPGQGVYRSSYMNAMRLARTEINMAYRDADRRRWAAMDFVVGFRIVLSNTHPEKDICDRLAGDYPKDFVFKGWHPQCKCHVIPILMDRDEFNTDELNELKAAIRGDQYEAMASRKTVTDIPEGFKDWIEENRERSLSWSKQPYFIRDNFAGGTLEGALQLKKPTIAKPQPKTKDWDDIDEAERTRYQDRFERIFMSDEWDDLVFACRCYSIDMSLILKMKNAWPANYDQIAAIEAEFNRLKSQCDATASTMKEASIKIAQEADAAFGDAEVWSTTSWSYYEGYAMDTLTDAARDSRWPNWPSFNRAMTSSLNDARTVVKMGKEAFQKAVTAGIDAIAKGKAAKVDVANLEKLVKFVPGGYTAKAIIGMINTEIDKINALIRAANPVTPEAVMKAKDREELRKIMVDSGVINSADFDISTGSFEAVRIGCARIVEVSTRFKLNKIGFNNVTFPKRSSSAAAHANGRHVEFNKSYFSGSAKGKEKIRHWVEVTNGEWVKRKEADIQILKTNQKYYADQIPTLKATNPGRAMNFEKIVADYQKKIDAIQKLIDSGMKRWTVDSSIEEFPATTVVHELGHTVHDQILGAINGSVYRKKSIPSMQADSMQREWVKLYDKYKKDGAGWLSEYGLKNDHEFMAECMVLYIVKKGEGLPADILEFIKKMEKFAVDNA